MKKGSEGTSVKETQEWLSLHGFAVVIDGKFGPATEEALKRFQLKNNLKDTGVVNDNTLDALTAPLVRATCRNLLLTRTLGDMVVSVAENYLVEHPREVGGNNCGPWVRYFMGGNEGEEWAWCVGFVYTIVKQACDIFKVKIPIIKTFSCDILARNSPLIQYPNEKLSPGAIFILKNGEDFFHAGIVKSLAKDFYYTIEGNTNKAGARDGIDVRERIRGYKPNGVDFIVI